MSNGTDPAPLPQWSLADRLRKIRRDRHMTQEQMAAALGIKPVTWGAWEAGRNRPDDVVQLATVVEQKFGVPAAWTLGVLGDSIPHQERRRMSDDSGRGRRWSDRFPAALIA